MSARESVFLIFIYACGVVSLDLLTLKRVVITTLILSCNMWLKVINQYEHYSLLYSPNSKLFIGIYGCKHRSVVIKYMCEIETCGIKPIYTRSAVIKYMCEIETCGIKLVYTRSAVIKYMCEIETCGIKPIYTRSAVIKYMCEIETCGIKPIHSK